MHLICNNSYKNKNYKLHPPGDEELNVEIVIVVIVIVVIDATLVVTKRKPEIFRLVSESDHLPLRCWYSALTNELRSFVPVIQMP